MPTLGDVKDMNLESLIKEIISDQKFPKEIAWSRRQFYPNEIVVKEGDVGKSLFFVESGKLRVSMLVELEDSKSLETGIAEVGKGDVFGDTCLYKSGVRIASVKTLTDCNLIEIHGEKLSSYLDAHPITGYLFYKELFKLLFKRLNRGNRRIEFLLAWGHKARSST